MTTFKELFGSWTAITITLNSLGIAAARQGVAVDNTTNLYQDVSVGVTITTASGTLGANPVVDVWAYAAVDGTPHYTDGASGSDASFTMPAATAINMVYLGPVSIGTAATATYSKPFSIASAFGSVPDHWGIVCNNKTGLALGSSGNAINYLGLQTQGV